MGYSALIRSLSAIRQGSIRKIQRHYGGAMLYRQKSSVTSTNEARVNVGIQNLSVGSVYEGFKLTGIDEVPDLNLTAVRLVHEKTGADYLHVSRDDPNNVFCIGFRTTPKDSTGVSHILEHTALCGSQKYPCRDPFFKMLNRSLSTFMNAMTGPDYTIYPFASQNEKDFQNLLSVYLDAVFKPQLRELDFLQEGWRLEHRDPNDPNSPLEFKGVVFNEMKGAFADSQQLLGQKLINHLLPSHTYSNVSGGDPPRILSLTWDQLKEFHAKHYHPSNSRIFTYGNLPLKNHLKFINENYLASVAKIDPSEEVPSESRWNEPRKVHLSCRDDPMAPEPAKQTTVVVSLLLNDVTDLYENFVLGIISELLIGGPNSPFYKKLVEPNIGIGYSPVVGYDSHTKDTSFSIGLQGVHESDTEKVLKLIDEAFNEAAEKGFDNDRIEAVLHNIELSVKHQSSNFGLSIVMGLFPLWNHNGDPVEALHINSKVEKFRQCLKENPDYLKEKIRQYFLNNKHRLTVTMSPDADFETKQQAEEQKLLEEKSNALTADDCREILVKGKQLLELQSTPEDVSCLPTLQMEDIPASLDQTHLDHLNVETTPIQVSVQPTNGITYFRAVLNASGLPAQLRPLLPVFCTVLTKMGAGDLNYYELDQEMELRTGGLSAGLHLAEGLSSSTDYEQGVLLSSHCLDRNVEHMFDLWGKILNTVRFDDENRLKTLLRNTLADALNGLTYNGHHYAMTSSASSLTPSSALKEFNEGITLIKRLKLLSSLGQTEQLLEQLKDVAQILLTKNNMRCSVNICSDSSRDSAIGHLDKLLKNLPGTTENGRLWSENPQFEAHKLQTHHVMNVPVYFTAKSLRGASFLSPDFAALRVLARLMSSKYLHPEIREKGGAYGGGAVASPAGAFTFYSYRDPRSLETLSSFDSSVNWAIKGDFNEEAIKEAKLGVFQKVDAPIPPGNRGMMYFLNGISDELLNQHRQAIIAVSKDDLVRVAQTYLQDQSLFGVTLIGPPNDVVDRDLTWNVMES